MTEKLTERGNPRFHPSRILPEVPMGKELHKFHGEPVLLTAREEGEPVFGNSTYTERQARELTKLAELRREIEEMRRGLNPDDPSTEALRVAMQNRLVPAIRREKPVEYVDIGLI